MKRILWLGSSKGDLKGFPEDARREAGYQLNKLQNGEDPDDWKPMGVIGMGVREIRIREESGAFRIMYVAGIADAIHVLHAFPKKSQKTSRGDLDIATHRYKLIGR